MENTTDSVYVETLTDSLDVSLQITRGKPSNREGKFPHIYMAHVPGVLILRSATSENPGNAVGFGDSMTDAVTALCEELSGQTVMIGSTQERVVLPVIHAEDFGSEE